MQEHLIPLGICILHNWMYWADVGDVGGISSLRVTFCLGVLKQTNQKDLIPLEYFPEDFQP